MSFKYDIFGGKPLSKRPNFEGARTPGRKVLTEESVADLVAAMRKPPSNLSSWNAHGSKLLSAYQATQAAEGQVKSYTNGVLTGAWKRVINHFFVVKQVKVREGDFTTFKHEKVYNYTDRSGKSHKLNSIEYFKKKHPRLYKRYLDTFEVLKKGGVVADHQGQLAFVQKSKFENYSQDEQKAILAFLSYAHYNVRPASSKSSAALAANRTSNRYGPGGQFRSEYLTALAQARKLSKNGKLSGDEVRQIRNAVGADRDVPENQGAAATLAKYGASKLLKVGVNDLFSNDGVKISYRGTSKSEKSVLSNAVKAKKRAIIALLASNDDIVTAIYGISAGKKQATSATKQAKKGEGIRRAVRLVQQHLTPNALDRRGKLAAGDEIFENAGALSHDQKSKLRKLANAIKLRAAAGPNGKVSRGADFAGMSVQDAINSAPVQALLRVAAGGRKMNTRRYAFDDEDDEFISGGSVSSYTASSDSFSDDSVLGGGRRNGHKNGRKNNSYIWFV
jgi:hypothetical protein